MIRWRHDLSILFLALFVPLSAHPAYAESAKHAPQERRDAELLALHKADRRAHFTHDIASLLAHIGPQLLDIRDGKINRMNRDQVRAQFVEYFQNAEFSAWDDVEPPVVRVSEDGHLAWMAIRVRITYTETTPDGRKVPNDSVMAWMSAYERQGKNWIMTAVTSTSEPSPSH